MSGSILLQDLQNLVLSINLVSNLIALCPKILLSYQFKSNRGFVRATVGQPLFCDALIWLDLLVPTSTVLQWK